MDDIKISGYEKELESKIKTFRIFIQDIEMELELKNRKKRNNWSNGTAKAGKHQNSWRKIKL